MRLPRCATPSCITLGLLTCCLVGSQPLGQDGYERAMELLRSEDFRGALSALKGEEDFELRREGEAELFYLASDYAAALSVAEAGLATNPDHLNLRFRAAASALWLSAGERALHHSEELAQSVRASSMDSVERAAWLDLALDYRTRSQALLSMDEDRQGAVSVARGVSITGVVLILCALSWALRPRRST